MDVIALSLCSWNWDKLLSKKILKLEMDAFALSCSLTWDKFQTTKAKTVSIFEDPVYSTYVTKDIFIEMYGACLETLDGDDETAFVDFYFEPSPLNNSIYIFRNEEAKLDFRDLAIESVLLQNKQ